jgi:hypothetical protein
LRTLATALLLAMAGCGGVEDACHEGQRPTAVRARRHATLGHLDRMHAHNDYLHARPLEDALEAGFHSVEADTWLVGSELRVGHWPWDLQGTLQSLYLDPLQARVDSLGSVLGDGAPFTLLVDLKERNPAYVSTLRRVLDGYPMLSRFTDTHATQRPVTVVFTGDNVVKKLTVSGGDSVAATRDGDYDLQAQQATPRFAYLSLDWKAYLPWDGNDDVDAQSRRQLGCIMENAHTLGYRVRLYNAPDVPAAWDLLLEYGADFINTDHLADLAAHLATAP